MQISLSGDLTTGHEMSKRQQAIWLLLIPVMKEVNRAMQDFTGTKYQTSDQYKDTTKDYKRLLRWLAKDSEVLTGKGPFHLQLWKTLLI